MVVAAAGYNVKLPTRFQSFALDTYCTIARSPLRNVVREFDASSGGRIDNFLRNALGVDRQTRQRQQQGR